MRQAEMLSPEWLALALDLADVLPRQPSLDTLIAIEIANPPPDVCRSFVQRFVDGRLTELGASGFEDVAIRLHCPWDVVCTWLLDENPGSMAASRTLLAFERRGVAVHTPVPPLVHLGPGGAMQRIPGANVAVHLSMGASPWGRIDAFFVYSDGQLRGCGFGRLLSPDVIVDAPFAAVSRFISGESGYPELLDEGAVHGDLGAFSVLLGLVGSPESIAAVRAYSAVFEAFNHLSAIVSTPQYSLWKQRLREMTTGLV